MVGFWWTLTPYDQLCGMANEGSTTAFDRRLRWSTHALFAGMALLALWSYRERIFLDSTHYLAHALNSGLPHVEHQRLVLALAELPALLAWHLALPMGLVLIVWSVGHVVWAWLAAALCLRWGRPAIALSIAVTQVAGRHEMYFSPVLETGYGATTALLLLAWWQRHPWPTGRRAVVWVLLAALLVTSHPGHLLTFLLVTALVWHCTRDRRVLMLAALPMILFVVLKIGFVSTYEHDRMLSGWWARRPPWLAWDYPRLLASLALRHFPDLLLLTGVGVWALLRSGRFAGILLHVSGMLAAILMVNSLMQATSAGWYHESQYVVLTVITLMLAAAALEQSAPRGRQMVLMTLLLVGVGRMVSIADLGLQRQTRRVAIEEFAVKCAQQGGKCVVPSVPGAGSADRWEWSLPMEALLLGSAAHGLAVSVIGTDDLAHDPRYANLSDSMVLFRRFEPLPIDALHPRFRTRPGPYVALE